MSGFDPASAAMLAFGTVRDIVANRATQNAASQQYAAQMAQLSKRYEIEERQRQDQLRREQATQRARAAAGGVGAGGGSADAILAGLTQRSATDKADRRSLLNFEDERVRSSLASAARRNLLETSFNLVNGILDRTLR